MATYIIRSIVVWLVLTLAQVALAGFETSEYDSEVTSYILEMHERFNRTEISKNEFEGFYKRLAKAPTAETLKSVTVEIYNRAQKKGNYVGNFTFVKSMHLLVLGDNPMARNSSQQLLSDEVHSLNTGKESQSTLLQKYLQTPEGQDRMAELVEGEVLQEARFKGFKISANN